MADALVKLPDDSSNTGKQVDNESLTVGAETVYRQRIEVAGAGATEIATVKAAGVAKTDMALSVRASSLGETDDTSASSDTGTFSVVALLKRLLTKFASLGNAAASASMPVTQAVESASGNITTQNLVPAGTATANSAVELTLSGAGGAVQVQVTGTYTGALSLQGTVDGTTWVTFGGSQTFTNLNTAAQTATIASAGTGVFTANAAGLTKIRVTALAAVTGTAAVTIRAVQASSMVGIDVPLPTGSNVIGALTANQAVNCAQMNGVTVTMGNGVSGTGVQRVTLASDSTGQVTLASGASVLPGSVNYAANSVQSSAARTSSGNGTSNSSSRAGARTYGVNVTAASGTNPTLDVVYQESADGGTTWRDAYHLERITATGFYETPPIQLTTGAHRVKWAIAGTTPSFTFGVDVQQQFGVSVPVVRQFYDRTANLLNGTASTTSSTYNTDGCKTFTLTVCVGAITTTAGQYKLQGSMDGSNWYDLTAAVTAVASSTVQVSASNVLARFVRATVAVAASGQTGNYIGIQASA